MATGPAEAAAATVMADGSWRLVGDLRREGEAREHGACHVFEFERVDVEQERAVALAEQLAREATADTAGGAGDEEVFGHEGWWFVGVLRVWVYRGSCCV